MVERKSDHFCAALLISFSIQTLKESIKGRESAIFCSLLEQFFYIGDWDVRV